MNITHRVKIVKEPKKIWISAGELPGEKLRRIEFNSKFDIKVFYIRNTA